MAHVVVEDVCEVSFDRALRGYRTQHVDAFLAKLTFARRAGTAISDLEGMVRDRQFPLAIGGYDCRSVDVLIESAAVSWRTHSEAIKLRDEALNLKTQLDETLQALLRVLDQASQQLRTSRLATSGESDEREESTIVSEPRDAAQQHYRIDWETLSKRSPGPADQSG